MKFKGTLKFEISRTLKVRNWKEHYNSKLTGKFKNRISKENYKSKLKGTLQLEIQRQIKQFKGKPLIEIKGTTQTRNKSENTRKMQIRNSKGK